MMPPLIELLLHENLDPRVVADALEELGREQEAAWVRLCQLRRSRTRLTKYETPIGHALLPYGEMLHGLGQARSEKDARRQLARAVREYLTMQCPECAATNPQPYRWFCWDGGGVPAGCGGQPGENGGHGMVIIRTLNCCDGRGWVLCPPRLDNTIVRQREQQQAALLDD